MRLALLFFAFAVQAIGAELTLAFDVRWGDATIVVPSADVSTAQNQSVRLTRFSALISGVTLITGDGASVDLLGQFGFIDAANGKLTCTFRNVPDGDYTGIGFTFGVPAEINHGDPAQWPAGHPLNPLTNRLHWSWQGGYVFVALEGRWRSAGVPAGAAERGFSYHLARDENVVPVRYAAQFRVDGATTITLAINAAKLLGTSRFASNDGSESTHSAEGDDLVVRLKDSLRRSIFWLGAESHAAKSEVLADATATPSARSARAVAFTTPAGFPAPNLPTDNLLTREGIALGERLFFDRRLSGNGKQSCADCHSAARAFSDNVALSRGAKGDAGVRNAMPLFNLAWSPTYAWDGSKPRIRDQALAAMTNPIEMHGDARHVVATLRGDAGLRDEFTRAFGTDEVTPERVGLALEQYLLTIVSTDSKFDRARRGEAVLTEQEKEGFALFMTEYDPARGKRGADCFHCHGGALFTDYDFKNNGLERGRGDRARASVTGKPDDIGKFKTPSLRNVAVTAPYMHDGRLATLEDVVAHYDHGVARSATLDPNLAKHPDAGLQLSKDEQQALVAFLRTLTDARWEAANL